MQDFLDRLAANLPHQDEQPAYARWLLQDYAPPPGNGIKTTSLSTGNPA